MTHCRIPFEGSEKKLEFILHPETHPAVSAGEGEWERVVRSCGADIVSRMAAPSARAFVLSESSLFVWEDRILLITCGQTNLVRAVPEIVDIVGRENVALVFYERKNMHFPHMQPTDFETDVRRLRNHFPGKSRRLGPADDDHVNVFCSTPTAASPEFDGTLQVLMHDLAPEVMDHFSAGAAGQAAPEMPVSRLSGLCRGMQTDSHFFKPRGYSLNGIRGKHYCTVHVTPQPEGSYASFETNTAGGDLSGMIEETIAIFRPGRFSVVWAANGGGRGPFPDAVGNGRISGYAITEKSGCAFDCGYTATLANYVAEEGGSGRGYQPL